MSNQGRVHVHVQFSRGLSEEPAGYGALHIQVREPLNNSSRSLLHRRLESVAIQNDFGSNEAVRILRKPVILMMRESIRKLSLLGVVAHFLHFYQGVPLRDARQV